MAAAADRKGAAVGGEDLDGLRDLGRARGEEDAGWVEPLQASWVGEAVSEVGLLAVGIILRA